MGLGAQLFSPFCLSVLTCLGNIRARKLVVFCLGQMHSKKLGYSRSLYLSRHTRLPRLHTPMCTHSQRLPLPDSLKACVPRAVYDGLQFKINQGQEVTFMGSHHGAATMLCISSVTLFSPHRILCRDSERLSLSRSLSQ